MDGSPPFDTSERFELNSMTPRVSPSEPKVAQPNVLSLRARGSDHDDPFMDLMASRSWESSKSFSKATSTTDPPLARSRRPTIASPQAGGEGCFRTPWPTNEDCNDDGATRCRGTDTPRLLVEWTRHIKLALGKEDLVRHVPSVVRVPESPPIEYMRIVGAHPTSQGTRESVLAPAIAVNADLEFAPH